MTMAEYLPGVVRGRCPPLEPEALKAQAVAERTFIYYHMLGGRKAAHPRCRRVHGLPLLQCLGVPGAGKKQLGR